MSNFISLIRKLTLFTGLMIILLAVTVTAMAAIIGDLDNDNDVDIYDFTLLVANFGLPNAATTPGQPTSIVTPTIGTNPTQGQVASACLARAGGVRRVLTGNYPVYPAGSPTYRDWAAPDNLIVDARQANWTGAQNFPVDFRGVQGGSGGSCFSGGRIIGTYVPSQKTHASYHSTSAFAFASNNFLWENTYAENYGDGVRIYNHQNNDTCQVLQSGNNFTIRGIYLKDMRDDCIENDWGRSGVIEDSLFEGCYVGISTRAGNNCADALTDRKQNIVQIKNTLIWMKPMDFKDPNSSAVITGINSELFKDEDNSPKYALHNNIIRADKYVYQDALNEIGYGVRGNGANDPNIRLASCSNNKFVWTGPKWVNPQDGKSYPYPPPYAVLDWRVPLQQLKDPATGQPCFTFTDDVSVWNNAVAQWKTKHVF